jgi:hypothetical protein
MIKTSLHSFAERIVDARAITAEDVKLLQRAILEDGICTREEGDVLIALDRVSRASDPSWEAVLVAAVVDFAVWGSRPTGYVDQDTARWLAASLACGVGPTDTARRIAFEIVKEAQSVDDALLAFAMRHPVRRVGAAPRVTGVDLAA